MAKHIQVLVDRVEGNEFVREISFNGKSIGRYHLDVRIVKKEGADGLEFMVDDVVVATEWIHFNKKGRASTKVETNQSVIVY